MFNMYLSPVVKYDCCVNDCVIFRDSSLEKFSKLRECPVCDKPRFEQGSKNISRKTFKYLPVETRIRRLFANKQHHL